MTVLPTNRPLRVAYLVQQFLPEVGAGPARVSEMVTHWRDAGAEPVIITAMPNRPEGRIHQAYRGKLFDDSMWKGIRVLRSWLHVRPGGGLVGTVLRDSSFMLTSTWQALRRAGPIDVLIASSPPFFPLIAGGWLHRHWRIPLVLELRDLWPDYLVEMGVLKAKPLVRAILGIEASLLRQSARVVVVSELLRDRVIAKGVAPDRVDVITNGVDPAQYYPSSEPPPVPELRHRGNELVVGYLGNFGAGQGLEAVLAAAEILDRRGAPVRFVLAGGGTEYGQVAERATRLRPDRLIVLPTIPKEQTRAFYNNADVCLVPLAPLPVFRGALPTKLFEIMACGRPIIASVLGEAASVIESSGSGWAINPGDPEALADAVLRMSALSPEERARMGLGGVSYVTTHYHRAALADRYLHLLRSVAWPANLLSSP